MSTHSIITSRRARWALLVALGGAAACGTEPPTGALELAVAPAIKAHIKRGVLTITGDGEGSHITLRLRAGRPDVLDVDVDDDGSADFSFDRDRFEQILVDAGGGDDVVRMDETNGAFTGEEQVTIIGGAGNDRLFGGVGAETFFGGEGDDFVDAGAGTDVAFLGDGNDTFLWDPGQGSDFVDGEAGRDVLVFNGAAGNEEMAVSPNFGRLRFTRVQGNIVMDLGGFEQVDVTTRGGNDLMTVNDLTGTSVTRVNIDLSAAGTGGAGDALADTVVVNGAATMTAEARDAAVVVTGPVATVSVTGGDPTLDRLVANAGGELTVRGSDAADQIQIDDDAGHAKISASGFNVLVATGTSTALEVDGLAGDDTIHAAHGLALIDLTLDGGDGDDDLLGGDRVDQLLGGDGDDRIDGGGAADVALLGDGDDTFIWNPGGGNDIVEGELGADVMLFNGAGGAEEMQLDPIGSRLRFFRSPGGIVMDVAGVERVDVNTLGGPDKVTVNDLAGTEVAGVNIDLGGDVQADTVIVNGAAGTSKINVSADGPAVTVTGPAATVSIANGERELDTLVANGADLLNIFGSDGADQILADTSDGRTLVTATGFDVRVQAGAVGKLALNGGAGDDDVRASGLAAMPLVLDGGDGDDNLLGGNGADLLLGGEGRDTIDGGPGLDTAALGPGDDIFIWNPGGGNDIVDGDGGHDGLVFNGADGAEQMTLDAAGERLRLVRNPGTVIMDVGGIAFVEVHARGGVDTIAVSDLTGTPVGDVTLDLGGTDGAQDAVTVFGSPADDHFAIATALGEISVTGLSARILVEGQETTDRLIVNGLGGADLFDVGAGVAGAINLSVQD